MMLVALPFFSGDYPLALANLQLVSDLGGVTDFPLLLVTDQTTSYAQRAEMQQLGLSAFKSVEPLILDNIANFWPVGPNQVFERVALHIATAHPNSPFLFWEPDATPTRPTWLREISAAYNAHGRLFMGAVRDTLGPVDNTTGKRMIGGKHMVGMGVYPPGFYFQSDIVRYLHTSPALGNRASGFDISLGDEIMLRGCYNSELFMHCWRTANYREESGRVVCDRLDPLANFDEPNLRIPAIVHGCKDTSLIALVRKNINGGQGFNPNSSAMDARELDRIASKATAPLMAQATHSLDRHSAVDPDYAEFLAFKAQRANKLNQAQGFQSSNGITFPSQEEIQAQRETMRSIVGNPTPAPVIPYEPTTQAELDAARMAAGGFGDELDNGFGVELPTGALTQADPMPPVQVADIPLEREQEASVASGSEVVAAETLPAGVLPAQAIENIAKSIKTDSIEESGGLYKLPIHPNSDLGIALAEEADKESAIKADIRAGVPYRERLKKWGVSSKEMKRISDLVDAEEAVEA